MKIADVIIAVLVQVLWGVGMTLGKPAVEHFPPLLLMSMVYVVTGACLLRSLGRIRTPFWKMLFLSAIVGPIQAGQTMYGYELVPASTAILIIQSQVPFSVLFGWLLAGERPSGARLAGMTLSFIGIVVIAHSPEMVTSLWPLALLVGGSAAWALGQVAARLFSRDSGIVLTAGIALYALPLSLLASALIEHHQIEAIQTATERDWITFIIFAIGAFVLSYCLWYSLLRRYRIDQVIPFNLLMPVVGVCTSVILLGESISIAEFVGGAIVIAGLAFVVFAREPRRTSVDQLT